MPSNTAHPVRIWFNRPFATSYWLFDMLRNNPEAIPQPAQNPGDIR